MAEEVTGKGNAEAIVSAIPRVILDNKELGKEGARLDELGPLEKEAFEQEEHRERDRVDRSHESDKTSLTDVFGHSSTFSVRRRTPPSSFIKAPSAPSTAKSFRLLLSWNPTYRPESPVGQSSGTCRNVSAEK